MKVAFTTVLDDKYLPGFLITLNSILRRNPTFQYDVIILDWGDLSDESKNVMRSLYSNLHFRPVDKELYIDHVYDETHRKWTYNCNYRFDIFTFTEYDRVIFFDCDMIFQCSIDELLSWDVDFGACAAQSGGVSQINREIGFDGGLMSIGKKYLTNETREALLQIAMSPAPYDENVDTTNWVSDEPILNTYFLDKMVWLPDKFNLVIAKLSNTSPIKQSNLQFAGHNKPWYGDTIEQQFSQHVLESIRESTNSLYMITLITKMLLQLFDAEVKELKLKNIDIYQYAGKIQPSIYE
jgi:lipopolysaccharide biosynthesis glycosyltransferase